MTSHSTHISVAHGDGAVVTVKPTDDGRWFRVLNWLVDAGHWSNLTDAQRNVFVVILRHRRQDDKLAPVSIAALCGSTRLRESAVYEAVKGLLAHKPPLLRKHAPGLWEPFPQRSFKARPDPTAANSAHRTPDPPGSATAESSPPWRNRVQHGGISPSHSPSAQSKPEDKTTTTNISVNSLIALASARMQDAKDETDRVVVLLESEGFEAADARRLIQSSSPAQVRKAIANANEQDRRGGLKNRRGYIVKAIREGWSLHAKLEQRASKALSAKLAPLHAEQRWPLDADTTARISRQYGGAPGLVRAGVVSPEEIESLEALELVGVIASRTEGRDR